MNQGDRLTAEGVFALEVAVESAERWRADFVVGNDIGGGPEGVVYLGVEFDVDVGGVAADLHPIILFP